MIQVFFNVAILAVAALAAPEMGNDFGGIKPRLFFNYPWFPLPQITRPTTATTGSTGTTTLTPCTSALAGAPSVAVSTAQCMCGTSTTPCPTNSYCTAAGVCMPSGAVCGTGTAFIPPCLCTGTTAPIVMNVCLPAPTTATTMCVAATGVCM